MIQVKSVNKFYIIKNGLKLFLSLTINPRILILKSKYFTIEYNDNDTSYLIGFLAYTYYPDNIIELTNLYIKPEYRGNGFVKILVNKSLDSLNLKNKAIFIRTKSSKTICNSLEKYNIQYIIHNNNTIPNAIKSYIFKFEVIELNFAKNRYLRHLNITQLKMKQLQYNHAMSNRGTYNYCLC